MIASLPMYPFRPDQVEALWQRVKSALPSMTLPASLSWPAPLLPHWQRTDLLLSQTCGYPLVTLLPEVQVVGAFHHSAPGCEGPCYRSWIVVRDEEKGTSLADFRGRTLAFNSEDSQSGYQSLMKMTSGPAFFSRRVSSGSHRRSLALLRSGEVDIAAIDCVSWALLQRDFAAELDGLRIIDRTASMPGLPLITSSETPPESMAALRQALAQVVQDPASRPVLERLMITRFSPLPRSAWQRCAS